MGPSGCEAYTSTCNLSILVIVYPCQLDGCLVIVYPCQLDGCLVIVYPRQLDGCYCPGDQCVPTPWAGSQDLVIFLGSLRPASQPAIAHRETLEHQTSSNELHRSLHGIHMSPYDSSREPPSSQNLKNTKEYCCFEEVPQPPLGTSWVSFYRP